MNYVIGIDEVGRGPVAGPIVVCACAVREDFIIEDLFPKKLLKDSKKLSEKKREEIFDKINLLSGQKIIVYGIGQATSSEIDEFGLSYCIKKCIQSAIDELHKKNIKLDSKMFLDGSLFADTKYINQETVIKGDEKIGQIALASIIAKVYRDKIMKEVGEKFPQYGFENHVGYGTKAHFESIKKFGVTEIHRKSFLKKIL